MLTQCNAVTQKEARHAVMCLSACRAPMSVSSLSPSVYTASYLCTCAPMCQHPVSGSLGLRDLLAGVPCKILLCRLAGYVQPLLQPLKNLLLRYAVGTSGLHNPLCQTLGSDLPALPFNPQSFSLLQSRFVLRFAKLLLFIFLIVFQNTHHFHLRTILPKEIR